MLLLRSSEVAQTKRVRERSRVCLRERWASILEHFIQLYGEARKRAVDSSTPLNRLYQIKPTFASFAFADKHLCLTQMSCEFYLRHARILTMLSQKRDESFVVVCMD